MFDTASYISDYYRRTRGKESLVASFLDGMLPALLVSHVEPLARIIADMPLTLTPSEVQSRAKLLARLFTELMPYEIELVIWQWLDGLSNVAPSPRRTTSYECDRNISVQAPPYPPPDTSEASPEVEISPKDRRLREFLTGLLPEIDDNGIQLLARILNDLPAAMNTRELDIVSHILENVVPSIQSNDLKLLLRYCNAGATKDSTPNYGIAQNYEFNQDEPFTNEETPLVVHGTQTYTSHEPHKQSLENSPPLLPQRPQISPLPCNIPPPPPLPSSPEYSPKNQEPYGALVESSSSTVALKMPTSVNNSAILSPQSSANETGDTDIDSDSEWCLIAQDDDSSHRVRAPPPTMVSDYVHVMDEVSSVDSDMSNLSPDVEPTRNIEVSRHNRFDRGYRHGGRRHSHHMC